MIGVISAGRIALNLLLFGLTMAVIGTPLLVSSSVRTWFQQLPFSNRWVVNYTAVVAIGAIGEVVVLLGVFLLGDALFPPAGVGDSYLEDRFLLIGLPAGWFLYIICLWVAPTKLAPRIDRQWNRDEFTRKAKVLYAGAIVWFQLAGVWVFSRGVTVV